MHNQETETNAPSITKTIIINTSFKFPTTTKIEVMIMKSLVASAGRAHAASSWPCDSLPVSLDLVTCSEDDKGIDC